MLINLPLGCGLNDGGGVRLDYAIGHEFAQRRQQSFDNLRYFQELDPDRKVLAGSKPLSDSVDLVMRAKTGVRTKKCRAGDALRVQKSKNLRVQEVALGTRVLVQVDDDLDGERSGSTDGCSAGDYEFDGGH